MRSKLIVLAGLAVLAAGAGGCGSSSSGSGPTTSSPRPSNAVNPNGPEVSPAGDIPDNQAYVAYSPPGSGYSVKVPEGWSRTASGATTSFTDKLNRIQMRQSSASVVLSAANARSVLLPALAKSVPGYKAGDVSVVKRVAGRALRITYLAQSPVDPVTGKSHTDAVERYLFDHAGKSVVLTLSGPKGADNVDPWKLVTDSLRYTR